MLLNKYLVEMTNCHELKLSILTNLLNYFQKIDLKCVSNSNVDNQFVWIAFLIFELNNILDRFDV